MSRTSIVVAPSAAHRTRYTVTVLLLALALIVSTIAATLLHSPLAAAAEGDVHVIPGVIEAEDYTSGGYNDATPGNVGRAYRADDVDLETAFSGSWEPTGVNVGWIDAGEWLSYQTLVEQGGSYTFTLKVATPFDGRQVRIELNGQTIVNDLALPNTGGWQSWTLVQSAPVYIRPGQHTLRVLMDTGELNIDSISVNPLTCGDGARTVNVGTAADLTTALTTAQPGDVIRLADGVYTGRFYMTQSGTPEQPITLCGGRGAQLQSPDMGVHDALHLRSNYTVIQGFSIAWAKRGIEAQNAHFNVIRDMDIHHTGQEAIHLRNNSTDNIVESSWIHDTGQNGRLEIGEGIYLGTDSSQWGTITGGTPDQSDRNSVMTTTFGPNVSAEMVEGKEGTTGGLIQGNVFIGDGMLQGHDTINAWVAIKGNAYRVVGNEGLGSTFHGFRVFSDDIPDNGRDNIFTRNVARVHAGGLGFWVSNKVTGTIISCDNVVEDAAGGFASIPCQ